MMRILTTGILALSIHIDDGMAFQPSSTRTIISTPARPSSTRRHAFALTSALESAVTPEIRGTSLLQWIDPSLGTVSETGGLHEPTTDGEEQLSLPLYPLSACHLPVGEHQLRNTHPRNIRMAQDVGVGGSFVVVLMAADTGRVASVGTLLTIAAVTDDDHSSSRMVLNCQAQGLVDIVQIDNPDAWSWRNRLEQSEEYLRATVRVRSCLDDSSDDDDAALLLKQASLMEDLDAVCEYYENGVGTQDLPPFTQDRLREQPSLLRSTLMTTTTTTNTTASNHHDNVCPPFWSLAQEWQTLCYTVREGHQLALQSNVNELMIDAAIRQAKGPLKLPVHLEDLPADDRQAVQRRQVDAQASWRALQLDPCADFQILLALSPTARWEWLAGLVRRERERLSLLRPEEKEEPSSLEESLSAPAQQRRGAWFNDDAW